MAPKPAGRPAAKNIPDVDMLRACDAFSRVGAPYPTDAFADRFPKKIAMAKLAKLHRRGWIDAKRLLTKDGRETLNAMEEKADG